MLNCGHEHSRGDDGKGVNANRKTSLTNRLTSLKCVWSCCASVPWLRNLVSIHFLSRRPTRSPVCLCLMSMIFCRHGVGRCYGNSGRHCLRIMSLVCSIVSVSFHTHHKPVDLFEGKREGKTTTTFLILFLPLAIVWDWNLRGEGIDWCRRRERGWIERNWDKDGPRYEYGEGDN